MLFGEGNNGDSYSSASSYTSDDTASEGDDVDSNMVGKMENISPLNIVNATDVSPDAKEVNIVTQEILLRLSVAEGVQQEQNADMIAFTLDPHTCNTLAVRLGGKAVRFPRGMYTWNRIPRGTYTWNLVQPIKQWRYFKLE